MTTDNIIPLLFGAAFLVFVVLWLALAAGATLAAVVRSGQISEAERDAGREG